MKLSCSLTENLKCFKDIFKDDGTYRVREITAKSGVKCAVIYIDGMVDDHIIDQFLIGQTLNALKERSISFEDFKSKVLASSEASEETDLDKLAEKILYGDSVFLVDGYCVGMWLSTKGFSLRSPSEPENETMLFGSHEGFIEGIMVNTSFIRRRIQSRDLKFKFMSLGSITKTRICICFLDKKADRGLLKKIEDKISSIKTDGFFDSNFLKEQLCSKKKTPFDLVGSTERPDTAAAKILEGKFVILVDGCPVALTLPYLFFDNFRLADDYNFNFYFTTFSRNLRVLSFVFTVTFPAFYLSLVAFHREMIPTPLLLSISESRSGVPFPTLLEAIGLLLIFELLREAGQRIPSGVGQALSVVGAIVIGEAAVGAKLISAPLVIIVAFTGLTGLMTPRLKGIIIVSRFAFLFLSAFFGLYGLIVGVCIAVTHIAAQNSFGVPYLLYSSPLNKKSFRDNLLRLPRKDATK